ncbi:hypothetical protein J007_02726, partial [Cryptococcus neoformans]
MSYPYLARTTIRVTGQSPEDEDWLVGETLDGSHAGGFPKDFVEAIDEGTAEPVTAGPTENESKTADNTAQQLQPVTQDSSKESEPPNVLSETDPKAGE